MNQIGGGVSWNKPPGLVCHICGREYGTTSLAIHLPQCSKLWKDRQKLLPRNERRPVPKAPMSITDIVSMKVDVNDVDSMERFNRAQMDAYTSKSLVPCQFCGRKFLEEKLPVHNRSCTAERPAASVGSHRIKPNALLTQPSAITPYPTQSPLTPSSSSSNDLPLPTQLNQPYNLDPTPPNPSLLPTLIPCSLCGRSFASDRVARHEAACHTAQPKPTVRPSTSAPTSKAGKWKAEHSEFQQAIQYAKQLTAMQRSGVSLADLPPPPPAANADYVECPHCGRRFNKQAAERHVPACANTVNRPKPPPQKRPMTGMGRRTGGVGTMEGSAKVKLSALAVTPTSRGGVGGGGKGGGGGGVGVGALGVDVQSQLAQLTATVARLAQQVDKGHTSLPAIGGGSGGGVTCRACSGALPAGARFCSHCGSPQS